MLRLTEGHHVQNFPIEITIGYSLFQIDASSPLAASSPSISAALLFISACKKAHQMPPTKASLNELVRAQSQLETHSNGLNPSISQEPIVLSSASGPHHQKNLPPPQDGFEGLKRWLPHITPFHPLDSISQSSIFPSFQIELPHREALRMAKGMSNKNGPPCN